MKLFSLFFLLSSLCLAKPLVFAYQDSENFPFQLGSGELVPKEHAGIAVDMLKAVAKELNFSIEFIRLPWKRGLVKLQQGKIDALFSASFKKERLMYGAYPLLANKEDKRFKSYTNSYALYTHKNEELNKKELQHVNNGICAVRGFSIVDDLRKAGVKVLEFESTKRCLNLLKHKRVEGVASLVLAVEAILKEPAFKHTNITKNKPLLKTKDYYLMLSHQFVKQNPKLAKDIWQAIRKLQGSERLKTIHKKYFY